MGRFTQFAAGGRPGGAGRRGLSRSEPEDADRCGVIVSSGIGGQAITESEHSRGLERGWDRVLSVLYPHSHLQYGRGAGGH